MSSASTSNKPTLGVTVTTPLIAIWDFDHSLIDDNSDTFIFDMLAPAIRRDVMPALRTQPAFACWTDLMDECLRQLQADYNVTKPELIAALQKIPLHSGQLKTIHALHSAGAIQFILSDANSVFIDSILTGYKLSHIFPPERIFTNPAAWTTVTTTTATSVSKVPAASKTTVAVVDNKAMNAERLAVRYHHTNKTCARCPRNLCKGNGCRFAQTRSPF